MKERKSGRPIAIPARLHERIRDLYKQGNGYRRIAGIMETEEGFLVCYTTIKRIVKGPNPKKPYHEMPSYKRRFEILTRDKFRCRYCGQSPMVGDNVVLEVDHILPIYMGGTNDIENLVTSCRQCNLSKRFRNKPEAQAFAAMAKGLIR